MSELNYTMDMTNKLWKQTHRKGNDMRLKFLLSCEGKIWLRIYLSYLVLAVRFPW